MLRPPMDTEALFRKRLRQLILERYPSVDRFHLEKEISKSLLSEILRGIHSTSISTLVRLAEALDVEVKDFFTFPEENLRHTAHRLLDQCSQRTLEQVVKLLTGEEKGTGGKTGRE